MILLIIIYLTFVSLGLPDSIIGVTIPALENDLGIPLSAGGLLSMFVIGGTIVSSFFSDRVIKRLGTGKIVFISTLITGLALLGYSISPSYPWLVLLSLPLGLGGGAIDVSLNNFIALHYKARHMNWLHSFWGIGASIGPSIMSLALLNSSWRAGYRSISIIQLLLALTLFLTLPIWKKHNKKDINPSDKVEYKGSIFKLNGIKYAFISMVLYCAVELGAGLWGSSYLVGVKGFSISSAAKFVSLYYSGITLGRVVSGFISFKFSNKSLIRLGSLITLIGIILIATPLPKSLTGTGLILIGFGLAPVFPAMLHETPNRFGSSISQKVIGYQMGFAYIGSAFVSPLLGVFYENTSIMLFPYTLFIITFLLILFTELLNRRFKGEKSRIKLGKIPS